MNSKQKRIESILKQLYGIHFELFGQNYGIGMALDEASQFNKIVEEFRELIFTVRSSQEERQVRQNKKNYLRTPDKLKINQEIRQDLARAEQILKEAAKRINSGDIDQHVLDKRQKVLTNCYNLLQDAKEVEEGGTYQPPVYPTLQQIKKSLMQNKNYRKSDSSQGIDMDQEIAFDKFNQKDYEMDEVLGEIVDVNQRARNKMQTANEKIDQTTGQIKKVGKEMDKLTERVLKADSDLAEVLKKYQRPSQFCLNITLVLMVLALVGVVISLIKGQTV